MLRRLINLLGSRNLHVVMRWWEERSVSFNRALSFIQGADSRFPLAIEVSSATDGRLLNAIANHTECDCSVILRAVAALRKPSAFYHFIFNKQKGVLCQPNQRNRECESVHDYLPSGFPHIPFAGRLDADTEGLLLFSDDGALLNSLIDPTNGGSHTQKEYQVQVLHTVFNEKIIDIGQIDILIDAAVSSMRKPIEIKGKMTDSADVSLLSGKPSSSSLSNLCPSSQFQPLLDYQHSSSAVGDTIEMVDPTNVSTRITFWLSVRLREGKNRQIRRLCKRAGLQVLRLVRTGFGPLCLGELASGQARPLSSDEVFACYRHASAISNASLSNAACASRIRNSSVTHTMKPRADGGSDGGGSGTERVSADFQGCSGSTTNSGSCSASVANTTTTTTAGATIATTAATTAAAAARNSRTVPLSLSLPLPPPSEADVESMIRLITLLALPSIQPPQPPPVLHQHIVPSPSAADARDTVSMNR